MEKTKRIDLTGQRFGMLTVTAYDHTGNYWESYWRCRCDCGNEAVVRSKSLRQGVTKSCGCQSSRYTCTKRTTHGATRGREKSHEYRCWAMMKNRCLAPTSHAYSKYGGRGITVCVRWRGSFAAFLEDMGPSPSPGHSIDRIDNDGDYCPENCRWATKKEQARNRTRSRFLTCRGETKTIAEWSEIGGVHPSTIAMRLKLEWTDEDAVFAPIRSRKAKSRRLTSGSSPVLGL